MTKVLKCIFLGSHFEECLCLEMHFMRDQFWRALMFWNEFFEGAIILEFMVADYCSCGSIFFIKVFITSKIFVVLICINMNLELKKVGCNQARYESRSICLEWLPLLGISSASVGKSVSDQWRGIVPRKSHMSKLKNWMREHSD